MTALPQLHTPTDASAFAPAPAHLSDADLDVDQLGARIVGLAGVIAAHTCRWLLLVAEFEARAGHERFGQASTTHWLAYACGLSARTARDHVRVARALAAFPALAAAMERGAVSFSHVRAISRATAVDDPAGPQTVADLLEIAEHGTVGQLESVVRGLRTADDTLPPDDREYVRQTWTDASMSQLSARLDPENGALVQSALDAVARAEGLTAAQALVRVAEIGLAAVHDSTATPRPLRGDERAAVVVHVEASAVRPAEYPAPPTPAPPAQPEAPTGGSAEPRRVRPPRPYARIADGPGLPDRVVTRLMCTGRIRTVVHDDAGNVRDLGRSHRLVSDRQFRALLIRHDGRCGFPGCRSRHALEAHHIRHWIDGGRTDLANLVLLCPRHHHTQHDGLFRIERSGGRTTFTRSDGAPLPHHVDIAAHLRDAATPTVRPVTSAGGSSGDRLDRHYAVAVLAHRRERARQAAATHSRT